MKEATERGHAMASVALAAESWPLMATRSINGEPAPEKVET